MRAAVVTVSNPFRPDLHRQVREVGRRRRIRALAPRTTLPFVAVLNGRAVLRREWGRKLNDGDVLVFTTLPQGGGEGGSNPLKIVLMLVVAWIAPYAAGWLNAGLGLGLGAAGVGALAAGVVMVGNMLINTLIPPPKPPTPQTAQALAAPSPTYSLQAQGNQARLDSPIPVIYGRHMVYLDFGAQPYYEYGGNEQYLYQLHVIGQGEYDIESIRIDDTIIENSVVQDGAVHTATGSFDEIDYQVVAPGGTVTLFPTNVVTSSEVSGQTLEGLASGTYSMTGTATVTVTETTHGRTVGEWVKFDATSGLGVDGVFEIVTTPTADTFTFTAAASDTTSGNCTLAGFVGPFATNAAGTSANVIAIDWVMARGLYYAETDGRLTTKTVTAAVYARAIDDDGLPLGSWTNIGNLSYSAATTTPQRQSAKYAVSSGRYEVMVARTNTEDTSTQAGHELVWGAARAYLPGTQDYGQITLLALRMRATNNLSNTSARKINVVVTRKLPIWDGSAWSANTATRSIAWAIADIARATYGGGRADSRIDLDGLLALDAVWTARGDRFDAIMDSPITVWEALTQAAKAGRAQPVEQGGVLHVVRDSAVTLPTAMFTPRNIVRGTMKLDYIMPSDETADAVDVEYFDSGVWQPRTVRAALPGSSESIVAKVKLFGVTDRTHAWREGMYMAAANRYRRRHIGFQTEMEGLILTIGDLIAVQHDMPQWGQGGEVTGYDGSFSVTLSDKPDFSAGGTHYIAFRKRDGGVDGPYTATATANPNVVTIDATTSHIYTGGGAERTHYAIGPANSQYIEARVISVRPRSAELVDVAAVVESDFVHTAETGSVPDASAWQLATRITRPALAGLMARSDPTTATLMFLNWQASAGAEHYLIEVSDSGNGWTRIGETRGTTFTAEATYGARTRVRVAPVGLTMGAWVEIDYGSSASYMWDAVDTTLMWDTTTAPGDGSAVQMWSY